MVSVSSLPCIDIYSFIHSFTHLSVPYSVIVLGAILKKVVRGRLLEGLQIWPLEDNSTDRRTIICWERKEFEEESPTETKGRERPPQIRIADLIPAEELTERVLRVGTLSCSPSHPLTLEWFWGTWRRDDYCLLMTSLEKRSRELEWGPWELMTGSSCHSPRTMWWTELTNRMDGLGSGQSCPRLQAWGKGDAPIDTRNPQRGIW